MRLRTIALALLLAGAAVLTTGPAVGAGNTAGAVKLGPDEGLVIFSVRSTDEFRRLRFEDPVNSSDFTIEGIEPGETLWVMRVKAGRYFMQYLRLDSRTYVSWHQNHDHSFWMEVRAGKLNYPGDLFLSNYGNRVSYHHGSVGLDELGIRVQRSKGIAPDLLERLPFNLVGSLAGTEQAWLRCHPAEDARWAAWVACLRRPEALDDVALVNSVFTRNGMPGIALGMPRAEVIARFKAVSARFARLGTLEGVEDLAWFNLGGWWGDRGSDPVGRLWFTDGRLVHVALREIGEGGRWMPLAPDAVSDLSAYASGQ